ncbi:hypothetical protein LTR16_009808, partial [Cryomyces antarcticus]
RRQAGSGSARQRIQSVCCGTGRWKTRQHPTPAAPASLGERAPSSSSHPRAPTPRESTTSAPPAWRGEAGGGLAARHEKHVAPTALDGTEQSASAAETV